MQELPSILKLLQQRLRENQLEFFELSYLLYYLWCQKLLRNWVQQKQDLQGQQSLQQMRQWQESKQELCQMKPQKMLCWLMEKLRLVQLQKWSCQKLCQLRKIERHLEYQGLQLYLQLCQLVEWLLNSRKMQVLQLRREAECQLCQGQCLCQGLCLLRQGSCLWLCQLEDWGQEKCLLLRQYQLPLQKFH